MIPLLSVIVPVYNEVSTIRQVLEKIASVNIDKEVIVVDDGSSDGTDRALRSIAYSGLKVIHHANNRGKGSAFLTGLANACGEFVVVQDADLEYSPDDYLKLMQAIDEDNADMVIGARFTGGYRGLLIPKLGNRFLSGLLNILFGVKLNDCFSCYKLCRRETINKLNLKSASFNIEIEIIIKALRAGLKITQVPITYYPRNYSEGKKIRIKDGISAVFCMLKYRFS